MTATPDDGGRVRTRAGRPSPLLAAPLLVGVLSGALGCEARTPLGGQCEVNSECDSPLVCRLDRRRRECANTRDCSIGALCVTGARGLGACLLLDEVSCRDDDGCPDDLVCRGERCTEPCDEGDRCAAGARCVTGDGGEPFCEDPAGQPCRLDSDCAAPGAEPLVCGPDLRCRAACQADRDCREGARCEATRCVPVDLADADAGAGADASSADGGGPDGGADGGSFDAGGAPPVPCASAEDCVAAGLALARCDAALGVCVIDRCAEALADCDGDFRSGCETSIRDDAANCGGCGVRCGRLAECIEGVCDPAVDVALGPRHLCVLRGSGELLCGGANDQGQLGRGTTSAFEPTLEPVPGFSWRPTEVFAGADVTCARVVNDFAETRLRCFGDNAFGQLGRAGGDGAAPMDVTAAVQTSPVRRLYGFPLALGGDVTRAPDGSPTGPSTDGFACGLAGPGLRLRCWGSGTLQYPGVSVGPGSGFDVDFGGFDGVTDVAAGRRHVCAIWRDELRCFGEQGPWLGAATTSPTVVGPTPVALVGDPVALAAGASHTCAALLDGSVVCWGQSTHGQLGPGVSVGASSASPVAVPVTDVVSVAAGERHTCALDATGRVRCWGDNARGELGDGTTTSRAAPAPVPGLDDVRQLSLSFGRSCALRSDGSVRCWGATGADYGVPGDTSAWMVPTPHPDFPGGP